MNVELAWMGAWNKASVFNRPKCKTDEAMVSVVGAGAGAGAILDKLKNCYILKWA